jgi:sugar phosphate isomerase/epimerase
VLAKTALVPVNLYGFIDYRSPDGGAGANAAFIDTAVRYGVARVMCIPNDFEKGVPSEEAYAVLRKGLADLVAKGAARGVTVMVEDFGGVANACSHQRYLERFLADIPGLCFALDSGNLYWAGRGEDIRDAFRYAAGRISHVHLKDQRKDNRRSYVTLGLGAVPNAEIVKTVHRQGYAGFYTLENPVGDVLEDVVRQVALVRHWTNGSR